MASSDTEDIVTSESFKEVNQVKTKEVTTVTSSNPRLLDQMHRMVRGKSSGEISREGVICVTVHKAKNIEKKGLVGKADPYVVLEVSEIIRPGSVILS